jgi:hypothetical protein
LHAALAPDAAVAVEVDDAVGAAVKRAGRADLNAGSCVAMIAAHDPEMAAGVRELALLDVLYPGAKHADGYVILFLARHRAGMTPDASILIEHKAIAHEGYLLLLAGSGTRRMKLFRRSISNPPEVTASVRDGVNAFFI